jgi:hypothetical protein
MTIRIELLTASRLDGELHEIGDVIDLDDDDKAKRLCALGVARRAPEGAELRRSVRHLGPTGRPHERVGPWTGSRR